MRKLDPKAEKMLRKAVKEYADSRLDALSDAPIEAHSFSAEFERKMGQMDVKKETRRFPHWRLLYRIPMGMAGAALVLFCLISPIFNYNFDSIDGDRGYKSSEEGLLPAKDEDSFDVGSASEPANPGSAGVSEKPQFAEEHKDYGSVSVGGGSGSVGGGSTGEDPIIADPSLPGENTTGSAAAPNEDDAPAGANGNIGGGSTETNTFTYRGIFNYPEEKETEKNCQTEGFVNTEATSPTSAEQVFALAKKEYTDSFSAADVFYDRTNHIWKVSFMYGESSVCRVYIRKDGITEMIAK